MMSSLSLSLTHRHTHNHPISFQISLQLIFMGIILTTLNSLNLGLHLDLVGTGLLNTVSLVFVPMNLAFKTFDLVCWI